MAGPNTDPENHSPGRAKNICSIAGKHPRKEHLPLPRCEAVSNRRIPPKTSHQTGRCRSGVVTNTEGLEQCRDFISKFYSRNMSIKTKRNDYARMQCSEYQSKLCSCGYRRNADGRMGPDPEAAAAVQPIVWFVPLPVLRSARKTGTSPLCARECGWRSSDLAPHPFPNTPGRH